MTNKIKRKLIILLSVILGIFFVQKYLTYKKYLDNKKLSELAHELSSEIIAYVSANEEIDILNEADFRIMIAKLNKERPGEKISDNLFNCCFGMKYHNESGFYLFYLCGEDGEKSSNNFSLETNELTDLFSKAEPGFIEYLLTNKDYDVILFGFKM